VKEYTERLLEPFRIGTLEGWTSNQRENSYILASQIFVRFTQHHTEIGTYPPNKFSVPNYQTEKGW